MHTGFVTSVFTSLQRRGLLRADHDVVAVAAGVSERQLFHDLGLPHAVLTNLDKADAAEHLAPFRWDRQDAQHLTYDDRSFDWAVVIDGLHHCSSPHRALTEMYRVARVGVVVIEARDSALMRLAVRAGRSAAYEIDAVTATGGVSGGVDDTAVPNHIYRWTEDEFRKTVRSFDPTGPHHFEFHHGLNLPPSNRGAGRVADAALRAVTRVLPRQRNSLAMIARRPDERWPWVPDAVAG